MRKIKIDKDYTLTNDLILDLINKHSKGLLQTVYLVLRRTSTPSLSCSKPLNLR
mgnify:CR=1 FL=1